MTPDDKHKQDALKLYEWAWSKAADITALDTGVPMNQYAAVTEHKTANILQCMAIITKEPQ